MQCAPHSTSRAHAGTCPPSSDPCLHRPCLHAGHMQPHTSSSVGGQTPHTLLCAACDAHPYAEGHGHSHKTSSSVRLLSGWCVHHWHQQWQPTALGSAPKLHRYNDYSLTEPPCTCRSYVCVEPIYALMPGHALESLSCQSKVCVCLAS